jgi:predicted transcriptional regulator
MTNNPDTPDPSPKQPMHIESTYVSSQNEGQAAATIDLDPVPQRVREIAMLRGLGYAFREIADLLNVSPQAVSLMLSRHRRSFKSLRGSMDLCNLSARAVNALGRHKIKSRVEARSSNVLELLRNERNCGRKTLEEITQWMDENPAQK